MVVLLDDQHPKSRTLTPTGGRLVRRFSSQIGASSDERSCLEHSASREFFSTLGSAHEEHAAADDFSTVTTAVGRTGDPDGPLAENDSPHPFQQQRRVGDNTVMLPAIGRRGTKNRRHAFAPAVVHRVASATTAHPWKNASPHSTVYRSCGGSHENTSFVGFSAPQAAARTDVLMRRSDAKSTSAPTLLRVPFFAGHAIL